MSPRYYYRRWKEITALGGRGEYYLMVGIALLDTTIPEGETLAGALPRFFSTEEEEDGGSIPLSVIRARAVSRAGGERGTRSNPADFPVSQQIHEELHIPVLDFGLNADAVREWGVEIVPDELRPYTNQGDVATYKGKSLVLLEHNTCPGVNLVHFAPLERVNPAT